MRPLGTRQQQALDLVRERGSLTAVELGRALHSTRERWSHPPDQVCDWCRHDGARVLASLHLRGVVRVVDVEVEPVKDDDADEVASLLAYYRRKLDEPETNA